ncbi:MAG TPA: hemolysin III family protein, partial [Chitinophagales bacterium]|nr:hemolysin III family protein [Chitinophagales bacterium]
MAGREQTLNEEIANAITHGLGILFSLIAIPVMIWYAFETSTVPTVWAVSIFGFGMLMVYLSSTLYHAVQHKGTKKLLQIWDHISIFLLIAGSYTPLVVKYTDAGTSKVFLTVLWGLVALGSFLKLFYTGRFKVVSVLLYLGMGWMAVFIIKPLLAHMPLNIFYLILASGLAYT